MLEGTPLYAIVTDPWVLAALGLTVHLLKKLKEANTSGVRITALEYVKDNPYHSVLSVIGAVLGLVLIEQQGMLNPVTAFSCGYMGNSMVDVFGNRAKAVVP